MFEVQNGKIQSIACEVPVAHHCHLTCRGCSHLSPRSKRLFVSPEVLERDLTLLARSYQAAQIRVLGGEPLMHPQLVDVLEVVRRSGVARSVKVTTNGVLLPRMTDDFWRAVDEVWISRYPGFELSRDDIEMLARRAHTHGVKLGMHAYDRFREATITVRNDNQDLVNRIFATCQVAHVWNCHTIDQGYFYKCPQSLFIPALLHDEPWSDPKADGVPIDDSPSFRDTLLRFLNASEPLAACTHCLGSAGKRFPHEQEERRAPVRPVSELSDLIDWQFLGKLESNPSARDATVTSSRVLAKRESPLAMRVRQIGRRVRPLP